MWRSTSEGGEIYPLKVPLPLSRATLTQAFSVPADDPAPSAAPKGVSYLQVQWRIKSKTCFGPSARDILECSCYNLNHFYPSERKYNFGKMHTVRAFRYFVVDRLQDYDYPIGIKRLWGLSVYVSHDFTRTGDITTATLKLAFIWWAILYVTESRVKAPICSYYRCVFARTQP